MHRSLKFFIVFAAFLNCLSIPAHAQSVPTVESGTLIMVARTKSAVVISVDSQINTKLGVSDPVLHSSDGERKIVDVGTTGACAISGWLGNPLATINVASSMRAWVKKNPTEGPTEAIGHLLEQAARTWDREAIEPGHSLPMDRLIGSDITTLICGDVVNGQPVIVKGKTFVQIDYSAGASRLVTNPARILYVDGVLKTNELPILIMGDSSSVQRQISSVYTPALIQISKDLQSNTSAINAFKIYQMVERSGVQSALNESKWTPKTVRALFKPVFETVECHMSSEVGPPNNVRIISACGRVATTVENDSWPLCPASPNR